MDYTRTDSRTRAWFSGMIPMFANWRSWSAYILAEETLVLLQLCKSIQAVLASAPTCPKERSHVLVAAPSPRSMSSAGILSDFAL